MRSFIRQMDNGIHYITKTIYRLTLPKMKPLELPAHPPRAAKKAPDCSGAGRLPGHTTADRNRRSFHVFQQETVDREHLPSTDITLFFNRQPFTRIQMANTGHRSFCFLYSCQFLLRFAFGRKFLCSPRILRAIDRARAFDTGQKLMSVCANIHHKTSPSVSFRFVNRSCFLPLRANSRPYRPTRLPCGSGAQRAH